MLGKSTKEELKKGKDYIVACRDISKTGRIIERWMMRQVELCV